MSQTNQDLDDEVIPFKDDEAENEGPVVDELTLLKTRARTLGIQHSNNISVETLRAKINAHLADLESRQNHAAQPLVNPLDQGASAGPNPNSERPMTRAEYVRRMKEEQLALVRVRIVNLDPKKSNLPGEIITVGNEYIGTVRKFVPFGEVTEHGYHVPKIILTQLQNRQFLNIRVIKKDGKEVIHSEWAREFAIDILPPLTKEQLQRLAAAQAAAGID